MGIVCLSVRIRDDTTKQKIDDVNIGQTDEQTGRQTDDFGYVLDRLAEERQRAGTSTEMPATKNDPFITIVARTSQRAWNKQQEQVTTRTSNNRSQMQFHQNDQSFDLGRHRLHRSASEHTHAERERGIVRLFVSVDCLFCLFVPFDRSFQREGDEGECL